MPKHTLILVASKLTLFKLGNQPFNVTRNIKKIISLITSNEIGFTNTISDNELYEFPSHVTTYVIMIC